MVSIIGFLWEKGAGGEDGGAVNPLTHGIPISFVCLFMDRWEGRLFCKELRQIAGSGKEAMMISRARARARGRQI